MCVLRGNNFPAAFTVLKKLSYICKAKEKMKLVNNICMKRFEQSCPKQVIGERLEALL